MDYEYKSNNKIKSFEYKLRDPFISIMNIYISY